MINAYERLGIPIDASEDVIKKAIARLAGQNKISINEAESYQKWLLDPAIRKQYNAKLFAEHPELIQQMVEEKVRSAKEDNEIENHLNNIDIIDEAPQPVLIKNVTTNPNQNLSFMQVATWVVVVVCLIAYCTKDDDTKPKGNFAITTTDAIKKCERLAKQKAANPATVEFKTLGIHIDEDSKSDTIFIHRNFTAQNAFGATFNYKAVCAFPPDFTEEILVFED